jgi:hypothetical protein
MVVDRTTYAEDDRAMAATASELSSARDTVYSLPRLFIHGFLIVNAIAGVISHNAQIPQQLDRLSARRTHLAIIDSMELWTGLVCLVPDPVCKHLKRFGDGKGAYVNVVAWAESARHFKRRVTDIAKEQLDCIVREIENVELLESTLKREGCKDEFFTMRTTAERQPSDVVFGGFHVWGQDDAN